MNNKILKQKIMEIGFDNPLSHQKIYHINLDVLYLKNFIDINYNFFINYEIFYNPEIWEYYYPESVENLSKDDFHSLYPLKSSIQISKPFITKKNKTQANFSFPIDIFMILKKKLNEEEILKNENKISILFEIYGLDKSDISHYRGFSILRIPLNSGFFEKTEVVLNTVKNFIENLKDYFFGSNYGIKDRYGFVFGNNKYMQNYSLHHYEKVCDLAFRINVLSFCEEFKKNNRKLKQKKKIQKRFIESKKINNNYELLR